MTLSVAQHAAASEPLSVEILDDLQQLRTRDAEWLQLCDHPEAHPATFDAVCRANRDLIRPHVVVVRRGKRAVALAVTRLQTERVPVRFGLATPLAPMLRVVRVSYRGVSGDISPDVRELCLNAIAAPVAAGEADAVFFDHVCESEADLSWISAPPGGLQRDRSHSRKTTHYVIDLPPKFEEFLAQLSRNERQNIRSNRTRVRREFGTRLRVECFRSADQLQRLVDATTRVAELSYLKALGVSFVDNFWAVPLLASALREDMARCYIASIDEVPVAFYHGLTWRGVFHGSMTGYDPAYAANGIGRYLIQHIIEDLCAAPGITQFDFGFGHADYKSRLGTRSWTEVGRYVFGRSVRARAVNRTRSGIEGLARVSDAAAVRLGVRDAIKSVWWRHATKK